MGMTQRSGVAAQGWAASLLNLSGMDSGSGGDSVGARQSGDAGAWRLNGSAVQALGSQNEDIMTPKEREEALATVLERTAWRLQILQNGLKTMGTVESGT